MRGLCARERVRSLAALLLPAGAGEQPSHRRAGETAQHFIYLMDVREGFDPSKHEHFHPSPLTQIASHERRHNIFYLNSKTMLNKLLSIAIAVLCLLIGSTSCVIVAAATELQGKTRISRYATNTLVESRLATTKITVEFVNEMDCATIRGFTMQLPINGRVTNLVVETSNECKMTSDVKTVLDAQEEFHTQSSAGKPAALLQAWDATQYPVWVSLPPLGMTTVEITFEE